MKMHSYMSVNGCLQHLNAQSQHLLDRLRAETEAHGGWNACLSSAIARQAELDAATSADPTPLDTPSELPDGTKRPLSNIPTADTLRKRLVAAAAAAAVRAGTAHTEGPQTHVLPGREKHDAATPMTLVDHPDEHISALAKEYAELESELTSSGPQRVRWPENVTFRSFAIYQLIPTLVYELEYPRTDRCVVGGSLIG